LGEVREHRFDHARIDRRGGVVIHVNRQLHRHPCRGPWPALAGIPLLRTTASSAAAGAGSLSAAISAMLTIPSVATIRSRICHSGPRTLHLLYCTQLGFSVEHGAN